MTRPIDQSPEGEDPKGLHAKHAGDGALKAQAPNSSDINQIAKGLSDTQREALMGPHNVDMAAGTASALVKAGCIVPHPYDPEGWAWSERAEALRTHLKGLPND